MLDSYEFFVTVVSFCSWIFLSSSMIVCTVVAVHPFCMSACSIASYLFPAVAFCWMMVLICSFWMVLLWCMMSAIVIPVTVRSMMRMIAKMYSVEFPCSCCAVVVFIVISVLGVCFSGAGVVISSLVFGVLVSCCSS